MTLHVRWLWGLMVDGYGFSLQRKDHIGRQCCQWIDCCGSHYQCVTLIWLAKASFGIVEFNNRTPTADISEGTRPDVQFSHWFLSVYLTSVINLSRIFARWKTLFGKLACCQVHIRQYFGGSVSSLLSRLWNKSNPWFEGMDLQLHLF